MATSAVILKMDMREAEALKLLLAFATSNKFEAQVNPETLALWMDVYNVMPPEAESILSPLDGGRSGNGFQP